MSLKNIANYASEAAPSLSAIKLTVLLNYTAATRPSREAGSSKAHYPEHRFIRGTLCYVPVVNADWILTH